MSDNYMPTTEDVRSDYGETYEGTNEKRYARFDRWLAAIEREAAARALIEAADALNRPSEGAGYEVWASGAGDWLRARAAEIREGK